MQNRLIFLVLVLAVVLFVSSNFSAHLVETEQADVSLNGKPLVVWYVIAKWLEPDFLDMVEKYQPDIVLLTIFAEDDVVPYHVWHGEAKVKMLVEQVRERGPDIYFSYSLFSRAPYDEVVVRDIQIEENIHLSDFSRYLKENEPDQYHRYFDYYLEQGLDPEDIPKVIRKPVEGYYIPIGHYTVIDPLYEPYKNFLKTAIEDTLMIVEPDGLAFDHIRFFTFDEGYNQDIRDYILDESGLDVYGYTPVPIFNIDKVGWTANDHAYYDTRARLISEVTQEIVGGLDYTKFGTTMGMIEPARSNGQYAELQGQTFDALLLMAYDKNPNEVRRNVKATIEKSGTDVILGISKITGDDEDIIENIDAGLDSGASGIYLLGYDFNEDVHEHLLAVRGMN